MGMPGIHIDDIEVPFEVRTLDGFRAWMARSEGRPGRASFFEGEVFLEMNQDYRSHEPVSTQVNARLTLLAGELGIGRYFTPPSWITWAPAHLSTEPDGFFARWESLRSGRLALHPDHANELVGVPDFVLEIISASSARKDRILLRRGYREAGVGEYWVIDARLEDRHPELGVFVLGAGEYAQVEPDAEGWTASPTFQRAFRLRRGIDPAGLPEFRLEARAPGR